MSSFSLLSNVVKAEYFPVIELYFPARDSINIPIVILEGKAWGFIIISGVIPLSVNGIFIVGHKNDITPF